MANRPIMIILGFIFIISLLSVNFYAFQKSNDANYWHTQATSFATAYDTLACSLSRVYCKPLAGGKVIILPIPVASTTVGKSPVKTTTTIKPKVTIPAHK